MDSYRELAEIEYCGTPFISHDCKRAVIRLLQLGDKIARVRILSCFHVTCLRHCLLLTLGNDELIVVKSGFASGYGGEGPRTFSYVLSLLDAHGAEIDEYEVTLDVMERADKSSLRVSDIERLDAATPILPPRWHRYILQHDWERKSSGTLWEGFPTIIPYAIIDSRIMDLAIGFWESPDEKLLTGHQRLEQIVRVRTGINEYGAKLFAQAFSGPTAKLRWKGLDEDAHIGRVALFTGSFLVPRDSWKYRAVQDYKDKLREFLLLNYLYCLEKCAMDCEDHANSAYVAR